jgi:hypothetical protein
MSHIDLSAIRHASLAFDMAPIPLYVKVAYLPDPHNELDGTIVCMDLYADAGHTKLLVDGVEPTAFTTDTQHEIEDELHRHLVRVEQKRRRLTEHTRFLADLMRPVTL